MARELIIAALFGIGLGIYLLAAFSLPTKWSLIAIGGILAPFAVMVLGEVKRLCLALIFIDIPLHIDMNFVYRDDIAALGTFGGLNLSLTTAALAVLYLLWILEFLIDPNKQIRRPRIWHGATLALVFYLSFILISVLNAQDTQLSLFRIVFLGQMFLLHIYLVVHLKTREDILFAMTMLAVGLIMESLMMIGIRAIGETLEIGGLIRIRIDGTRVGGTVGGPNTAAAYISLIFAPIFSLIITEVSKFHKLIAISAVGLGALALLLTLSRGGWIAVGLSTGIFILFAWYRGWLPLYIPLLLGFVGFVLMLLFGETVLERFLGDDEGSASSRIPLMLIAFRMISNNFLLGVGTNNFATRMYDYLSLDINREWLYTVHNHYLFELAEAGIGAFLSFLAFLGTSILNGWRAWWRDQTFLAPLALTLCLAILGHMTHMMFDYFNSRPPVQTLWVCAAIIAAIFNLIQQERKMGQAPVQNL